MTMNRRQFLKATLQVSAGYAVMGVGLHQYGTHIEAQQLVVEHIEIPIKNLKPSLEGFTIAQLTDLHLYPYTQADFIQKAVDITNNLKPDVTVLTGDYITDKVDPIFEIAPIMASLNAKHGVFASLGNHEIWTNEVVSREAIEKAGVPVLVNQGVSLNVGKEIIYVAGLDDSWSGKPDLKTALANRPADVPTILLAHEPDFADEYCLDGRVSLQLSGHSHGGQVRIPGIGAPVLASYCQKYDQGLFNVNGMWVYTNRGVGSAPVPYRVNCPPEIAIFTLVGA